MSNAEFTAYIEGLPPQDRRTVEQALHGLRHAMNQTPRDEVEVEGRNNVRLMLEAVRQITRRERPAPFWRRAS